MTMVPLTTSERLDAEAALRAVSGTTAYSTPSQPADLPPPVAAKLAELRAGLGVTEVVREEAQRFVVTVVCRRGDDTLDSFTALNLGTQKLWHFMGHMVAEADLAKVRPNAQFWEISALQTERCGSRVRSVILLWED